MDELKTLLKQTFGLEYIVENYREEGGAAKNTETKIVSDKVFREAVKAYLKCDESTIREKFYPFLLFIKSSRTP